MTIIDNTWARIVWVDDNNPKLLKYFRFQEHGGITTDFFNADYALDFSPGALEMEQLMILELMKLNMPNPFKAMRLCVEVKPFTDDSERMLRDAGARKVKENAARKLNNIERITLGML